MTRIIDLFRFEIIRLLERSCGPETIYRWLLPVAGFRTMFKKNSAALRLPPVLGAGAISAGSSRARRDYFQNCALTFFPERLAAPVWRERCEFSGLDLLRDCQRQGQPAILAVCHFGPVFLLRRWLQAAGIRAATLVAGRADERSGLNRLKDQVTLFPEMPRVFYPQQLRELTKFLAAGNVLIIAVDSPAGNQVEIPVDPVYGHFNFRMATGPLRLAARHGARLFPCLIRDEGRWRFRIELGRPVPPAFLSAAPDLKSAGKHVLDELLPRFRACPEQCAKMLVESFRPVTDEKHGVNQAPSSSCRQAMNLNELVDETAGRWPQKAAIIEGETTVTYSALVEMISDFERRLAELSLPPGCRVGLQVPGNANYIALTYALWRIRAVVIPIPVEGPEEEAADIADQMQLEAVLRTKPVVGSEIFRPGIYFSRLTPAVAPDNHGLNLAFIRFTSGTTSARKGVALCHETIRDRVVSANRSLGLGPADVVMWNLPMSHHFLITIVLYLSRGATIVLARHAVPRSFLTEVNRRHGTVLYAAPRYYAMLARDDSGMQLPSVRLAISTTSSLPEDVAKDFHRRFNLPLIQALGVIELGLVAINLKDPLGRCNSVGPPAGDFRVRIASPDENGCGELAVSGPGMLDAYAAPWIPRGQILAAGWFYTGDIARMDSDGFIYLLSRTTAVINRAGQKIFPEEVEAVINRHPDVRESRVFGRRHPRLGEMVEAELVLARGDASLARIQKFCREQLAAFKIPARLHVVAELPKTAVTGKIHRGARPMPGKNLKPSGWVSSWAAFFVANGGCDLIFNFTSG
jgi:long-chain acyl-CoA synthetase